MKLDFTILEELPKKIIEQDFNTENDEVRGSLHTLRKDQRDREEARQVMKEYQENIKKSEELRREILKGINQGESTTDLLIKALECISLTTGDTVIYNQGKNVIINKYGSGTQPSREGPK